jgi:hypothetical protein
LHTATLLGNGMVLVAGGFVNALYLSSAELYDPSSNSWAPAGTMSAGRDAHTATLLGNGKVLVAGGDGNTAYLSSAELYDPSSNSWAPAGTMSAGRDAHTATLLGNGKVLVAGGEGNGGPLSRAELYVDGAATTTAVSASPNPSVFGQQVTLTATVTSGAAPVTGGSVTFRDGATTLAGGVAVDGSGHARFTTASLSAAASPHVITADYAGTAQYNSSSGNVSQTVNRAPLTITADSKAKVYGQSNPILTASISGFVAGDFGASFSGTLMLTTPATAASGVGAYAITASGLNSTNYAITYVSGTLTVTRADLTVTADNKSKVYGQPNPPLTASYTGFVNGDTAAVVSGLTLSTTATAASGVGAYPITPPAGPRPTTPSTTPPAP